MQFAIEIKQYWDANFPWYQPCIMSFNVVFFCRDKCSVLQHSNAEVKCTKSNRTRILSLLLCCQFIVCDFLFITGMLHTRGLWPATHCTRRQHDHFSAYMTQIELPFQSPRLGCGDRDPHKEPGDGWSIAGGGGGAAAGEGGSLSVLLFVK